MVQTDIALQQYYRFYRFWWLIVLAALTGGGAGWLFHRLQPPLYDATASIIVTVDFSQAGNLSAYNLDQAVQAIQGIFYSTPVIQPLIERANIPVSEGYKIFVMERYGDTWMLRVRLTDPQLAAQLANIWAETGYQALLQAHAHAQRARILSRYLNSLANCPNPPQYIQALPAICLGGYTLDITAINSIQEQLQQELVQSSSINASLIFNLGTPAETPSEPAMYPRSELLLAGVLLGFLVAVLWLSILPVNLVNH